MPDTPLRILLLEDSPLDARLTLAALTEAGLPHVVDRVDAEPAYLAALARCPDLILSEYALRTYTGPAALAAARGRCPGVPFVFVSGAAGEELAVEALKAGATDYVLKPRLARLGPAVRRAVGEAADRRDRAAADRRVHQGEDRYRFLADTVPQIVWTARADGTVDYCNARWHEYTGLTADQTRGGGGWAAAVHPDDQAVAAAAWDGARAGGGAFEVEHRLRSADGRYRWHLTRGLPRRDADGGVAQWVGTATDIDDRRRIEHEHRRLLGRLDAIIGHMNEGLVVADGAGHVLSMNAAGLRLYGLSDIGELRGHISGLADRIAFAAADGTPIPTDRWPVARALAGEAFTDYVLRVHRPAADRRWVASYAGTALRGDDGRVEMAVVTFRDVTAQKQAEADLAQATRDADQARELAEAANRTKDEFLATLSHELRTPLNAILGWTQLLRADDDGVGTTGPDPDDVRQGLATIERNARVQAQLVEDLLDVSRIISGKLRLTVRPADLREVLAAAADAVRPAADAKGVRLDLVLDGPVPVVGDPDRLQQVAWNLMANAIKFTPAGGAVTARAGVGDGRAELTVADTGQGIAAEFLPHVFERFRQADGTTSRKHSGLGLGLAIVRHLVDLHGGDVWAESDGVGRGSTFRVCLPPADGGRPPADAPAPAQRPPPEPTSLLGVPVVVVDDEPDARSLVAVLLKREGAVVTTAATADDAMTVLRRGRPAVLVSDVDMPGEDGYALIARVRGLPAAAGGRTPAVALTAYARAEDRGRVLAAGFDAHVAKPVDAAALVAVVARLATAHAGPAESSGSGG